VREDAFRFAVWLSVPVTGVLGAFGLWTQLAHGNSWTWIPLAVAVVALLAAVGLMWSGDGEGWAFLATTAVVAAVVIMLFGCLYPNLVPSTIDPAYSLTIYNASSSHYTLTVMTWAAVLVAPVVIGYQAWSYWVFRQRISAHRIPASVGLTTRAS
jgi:cytochrome d ubiquinol oxidase subunit II